MAKKKVSWVVALGCAGLLIGIAARRGGSGLPTSYPRSRSTVPVGPSTVEASPPPRASAEHSPLQRFVERSLSATSARTTREREILARVMNEGPSPHLLSELERTLREAKDLNRWGRALWGLSRLDTPETVEILARYVRTPAPASRRDEVIRHLGGMREPAAPRVLFDLAAAGPSDAIAGAAMRALVQRSAWDPSVRDSVNAVLSLPMWQSYASVPSSPDHE